MSSSQTGFTKVGFAKAFLLPALLIYLIPVLSLLFFLHAQDTYNRRVREAILTEIQADKELTDEKRAEAIEFFTNVPFSRLVRDENFAQMVGSDVQFHFKTFRWMIILSVLSIASSILVFLVAGVCVLFSLSSAFVQYLSLSISWHVLRIYGALQTIAQGTLLVALSFWVTALWAERYYPKLILMAGLAAIVAAGLVILAIFQRVKPNFTVQGEVIEKGQAMPLWDELSGICAKVGTELPDQVIVGIDDNFFVTEQPVTVRDKTYTGRTLFVSLSLLKQLQGAEADAVLAHEMAHFSGNDTLYSRKISPLLNRYGIYLQALHDGGITKPIFYYMLFFRALYEISLRRHSRRREFRADHIAVETTSSAALAGALLRIIAYSKYRNSVENELFKQEQVLETANVSERIEQGFPQYATLFASGSEIADLPSSHPFDSHPPLSLRLEAIGVPLYDDKAQSLLANSPDGAWYQRIHNAEQIERGQWSAFEEHFRLSHERSLPYRFIPETDDERTMVLKFFPGVSFEGKDGPLTLDYEKLTYAKWPDPIRYNEIKNINLHEGVLTVSYTREKKLNQSVKMKVFGARHQEVIDALNHYYTRYVAAREYQKQKLTAAATSAG